MLLSMTGTLPSHRGGRCLNDLDESESTEICGGVAPSETVSLQVRRRRAPVLRRSLRWVAGSGDSPARESGRGRSPDRHVGAAVAGEQRPVPLAPALRERHVGELCHEIKLGRPDVAERDRLSMHRSVDHLEVV